MGTDSKKITVEPNTNAKDKPMTYPSTLKPPQKISPSSTTCTLDTTRTHTPRTKVIVKKLWKGQKLTDEIFTSKKSNHSLTRTTLLEGDMYITHRIHRSARTSAPKKPPTARKSSESIGESRNRLGVTSLDCSWGTHASRGRERAVCAAADG